jgi:hypothetical protein
MGKKRSKIPSQATDADLVEIGQILTPPGGGLRVRPDLKRERLSDGVYIQQIGGKSKWVISFFRDVMADGNDVEVAIDVAALVSTNVGIEDPEAGRAWLTLQRNELQYVPSGKHTGSEKHFRLGLKVAQAKVFAQRLQQERVKRQGRWALPPGVRVSVSSGGPGPTRNEAEASDAAITRMISAARSACSQSGKPQTTIAKNKEFRFTTDEAHEHLAELLAPGRCAITKIEFDLTGSDPELAPSLDRKDSNGHYEPGNVQVLAWFVNRWKSDDPQENFERLLGLVKQRGNE